MPLQSRTPAREEERSVKSPGRGLCLKLLICTISRKPHTVTAKHDGRPIAAQFRAGHNHVWEILSQKPIDHVLSQENPWS